MKMKGNRISLLLLSILFMFLMGGAAYAAELPDVNRKCSLTFHMLYGGNTPIPGGSLTLYHVGEVAETDGDYRFEPSGDFVDCGESFDDLGDITLAVRLQAFAQRHSIAGTTKRIDSDGEVSFDELQSGLYLVVQWDAAPGYQAIEPFLISLPYLENGTYIYDLVAAPKTEPEPDHPLPETPPDAPPDEPSPDTPPDTPPDDPSPNTPPGDPPDLPQTGQLWWPVPVLACAGLLLFIIGIALNRRRSVDEG